MERDVTFTLIIPPLSPLNSIPKCRHYTDQHMVWVYTATCSSHLWFNLHNNEEESMYCNTRKASSLGVPHIPIATPPHSGSSQLKVKTIESPLLLHLTTTIVLRQTHRINRAQLSSPRSLTTESLCCNQFSNMSPIQGLIMLTLA